MKIEVEKELAKDLANLVVQFKKCVLESIKGEEMLALYSSIDRVLQFRQKIIEEAAKAPSEKKEVFAKKTKKVKKVKDADKRKQPDG